MIRTIRKFLDKLPASRGIILAGQWRVLYNDGRWSRRFTYDVAKDYAEMFGGTVHHVRYNEPAITKEK